MSSRIDDEDVVLLLNRLHTERRRLLEEEQKKSPPPPPPPPPLVNKDVVLLVNKRGGLSLSLSLSFFACFFRVCVCIPVLPYLLFPVRVCSVTRRVSLSLSTPAPLRRGHLASSREREREREDVGTHHHHRKKTKTKKTTRLSFFVSLFSQHEKRFLYLKTVIVR